MLQRTIWQRYDSERVCKAQRLSHRAFRRHYGVKHAVFEKMIEALELRDYRKKRSGRPSILNLAEQALCALEFWREYPTLFHHAYEGGLDERTAGDTIERVEKALLASGLFRLEGKKALTMPSEKRRLFLIDATEQPVERPKKTSENFLAVRKSGTRSKLSWSWKPLDDASYASIMGRARNTISPSSSEAECVSVATTRGWPIAGTKASPSVRRT
jgi:hypothetical protein